MANHDAGVISANGVDIPIQVTDEGEWIAEYDGRTLHYPLREKLDGALRRLTKRAAVQVAVPVVQINKQHNRALRTRATVTGVHGANGNILVTLHKGGRIGDVKEQISSRFSTQVGLWFGGDVTDEQIAEYSALVSAEYEAAQARRAMENLLKVDLFKVAEAALAPHVSETD